MNAAAPASPLSFLLFLNPICRRGISDSSEKWRIGDPLARGCDRARRSSSTATDGAGPFPPRTLAQRAPFLSRGTSTSITLPTTCQICLIANISASASKSKLSSTSPKIITLASERSQYSAWAVRCTTGW
ncbi:hypothetical protein VPH35_108387 [Triticum aestivum]